MGRLIEKITAGSRAYAVQKYDGGYILVSDAARGEEFSEFVRELLNHPTDEFVVLPISDGHMGYERAVILT